MAKAKIEKYHGEPAVMVNGEAYPPMMFTPVQYNREYLKRIGEAGIRIFFLGSMMRWNRPGDADTPDGIAQTLADIRFVLDAVPDAYIVLRTVVDPTAEWIAAHPDEQVLFSDGTHEPVLCTSGENKPTVGMISFASESWKREGKAALIEYLTELKKDPVFERVIGVFLCAGGTGEWYYPGKHRMHNEDKGTYADCSEAFRGEYTRILKEKYGSEEELRRVWNRADASFERPTIPDLWDRTHIYDADREIVKTLAYEEDDGAAPKKPDAAGRKYSPNVGVFLNANDGFHTADFFAALNEATAQMIVHFAKAIKEYDPDLLTGAFYGYNGCVDYYGASHTTGVPTIIDSGAVDFLAAPGVYNNREPGGVIGQREMQDSLRIRNRIFISEDDSHSHISDPLRERESMGLYTARDSLNTLKREFARDLCEEINAWWFDMSGSGWTPWYDDAEILNLFRRQQEIGKEAYSLDRTKHNEIALLYDTESVHMVSDAVDRMVLDHYRTSDLHRIGAPVDYYYHNDVSLPQMPDYKLYIVMNAYCLTAAEREAIFAKARKNQAAVLWLYAPGFIDPSADRIMDTANIEKTVGMKVGMDDRMMFPYFHTADHPALRYADPYRRYGYIDRPVHSNVWMKPTELTLPYLHPRFFIDDENVTVLGRYGVDGRIAFAMREDMGFTSIYCATPVLRSELLKSLAEYAGCHIYTRTDDVLYANDHFVAVHASSTGTRRICFRKPCSPLEVYEERFYGHNAEFIDVDMYFGETKMWELR